MMTEIDFLHARRRMVQEQLQERGIRDPRLLAAFQRVPRHSFVPQEARESAYEDHPLEIGAGQTISQPYMVATMLDAAALAPGLRVLEIGTGSGYQTALLCELGAQVYTIERIANLWEHARGVLEGLGYRGVRGRVGDGTLGWPEEAPFDRILVTAAAPRTPAALVAQLALGGRMLIPVGRAQAQVLLSVERDGVGRVTERELCGCVFVPLIGCEGWADPRAERRPG